MGPRVSAALIKWLKPLLTSTQASFTPFKPASAELPDEPPIAKTAAITEAARTASQFLRHVVDKYHQSAKLRKKQGSLKKGLMLDTLSKPLELSAPATKILDVQSEPPAPAALTPSPRNPGPSDTPAE